MKGIACLDLQDITQLNEQIVGDVITPDHPAYDAQRIVFNRAGRPAIIVRCQGVEDIVTALRFAREQRLPMSVRSGGHGVSGQATNDGGLILDLAGLDQINVLDPERRLVRVGAGARWGAVADTLEEHDLALSSGDTRQVGVGGLTLGGGIGWMVRTHGLTIDSLRAVEVITADGRVLRASAEEHPDLFWAIRGGGGNFGVVTSFDFEAHPCQAIVGGSVIYDTAEAKSVLANWTSAMRDAPDELTSMLDLESGSGPQPSPQLAVLLCYAGDDEAAARDVIAPFLRLGAVRSVDVRKKPYHAMLGNAVSPLPSHRRVMHAGFVRTLSDEALETLAAHYGHPGAPSAQIRSLGGAVARVAPLATAFAHRQSEALIVTPALAPASVSAEEVQRIRQANWRPLEPWSSGAFGSFLSDVSSASVAATYPGETYARLARVKATYDPENVFDQNLNIMPAASA
jgi:FAD/FMN-containing dehydrogenase